jgi:hypothetical protein
VNDFNGDGVPDIGMLTGDRLAVLLNRRGRGPTQNVADASLTATGADHPATANATFLGTLAHFTDANPNASIDDFSAAITWGDGQTSAGTILSDGEGGFTVLGSHVFSTVGTYAVSTAITDKDGAGATASGNVSVTAGPDAPLTAIDSSIAATARVSFTGTVAMFTSTDATAMAGNFTATITWGDGHTSPGFVRAGASGGFEVQGTNTYAQAGNYDVTVAIVHTAGTTASTQGSAAVDANTAPPLTAVGDTINATEQIQFDGMVATFTDGDPNGRVGGYSASIDWGDGQTSAGTVTADSQNPGQFVIAGAHVYRQLGTLPISIAVASRNGAMTTATAQADVAAAPLNVHDLDLTPVEGVPFGGVVATFSDAIPFTTYSDYSATINWGDGHSSPGTVAADPNIAAVFDVTASTTYGRFGVYQVTITIGARGHATTTQARADVADAPLSAQGLSISAIAGTPYTGIVASFTDQNASALLEDYSATIFWGKGHISPGTITANEAGGFDVTGTNTFSDGATAPVLVWIQDAGGSSVTATSVATVVEPAGAPTAQPPQATEGTEFSGPVAWFTPPPNYLISDFTATIDWGDGHTTVATFATDPSRIGQIAVLGTSTYAEEGQFAVVVTVTIRGGIVATINETALVADALLTANGQPIHAIAGQTFTGLLATFTDANPAGKASDFTAQINWGDGQTSAGEITADLSIAGQFDVTGTIVYSQRGSLPISVTIADTGGASVVANSTAKIIALPTVAGTSADSHAGVPFSTVVATIADANPEDDPSDFSATIDWDDGHSTPGLVTHSAHGTNTFAVLGSSTYTKEGVSPISVVVTGRDGLALNASSSVNVTAAPDAPLFPLASLPLTAEQNLTSTYTVALFRDSDPGALATDLTATISWGDGTTSTGRVMPASANSGVFIVVGSHTYSQSAAYRVTTSIVDVGGATASASTGLVVTADQAAPSYQIGGAVFLDYNADGQQNPGEPSLAAVTTYLDADHNGHLDSGEAAAHTATDGSYSFDSLDPGAYAVRQDFEPDHGIALTTAATLVPILASGASATGQNFGEVFISQLAPVEVAADRFGGSSSAESAFVHGLYINLLKREPDENGLAYWTGRLAAGANSPTAREEVAAGLWESPEHRGLQVDHYYATFLHRQADPGGRAFFIAQFLAGARERAIVLDLVLSQEYRKINSGSAAFVQALYRDVLSRDAEPDGTQFWMNVLAANGAVAAAQGIMASDESLHRIADGFYAVFLHRPGEETGQAFWLERLRGGQDAIETTAMGFLAGNSGNDEYFSAASSGSR